MPVSFDQIYLWLMELKCKLVVSCFRKVKKGFLGFGLEKGLKHFQIIRDCAFIAAVVAIVIHMPLLVLWSAFLKMQKHRLQKYQEWLTDHWHDHCLNLCIFCQQCYDMKTMSCSNNRYFNRSVSLFATIVFWRQTLI